MIGSMMTHTPSEGLDLQAPPVAALIGGVDHPAGAEHQMRRPKATQGMKRTMTRTGKKKATPLTGT